MKIGQRLRDLRESQALSLVDLERRSGLLCSYTSRVENGRTVPLLQSLQKFADALQVPLYKFFHEDDGPISKVELPATDSNLWGSRGQEHRELRLLAKALSRMDERQRKLLMAMAFHMAGRSGLHKV